MAPWADRPWAAVVVAAAALGLAALAARHYAGGWNDGSRLAAAESLIDRGTLAIDDSVFVRPANATRSPYDPDKPVLAYGTLDKLFIDDHFHSDKPAVANVLTAAVYWPLMGVGLPRPAERPDVFAWVVTVLTSGVGYAAAVGCLWSLGRRIGLPPGLRLAWVAAFGLSTFALTYTQHVSPHTPQLAVVTGMILLLLRVGDAHAAGRTAWGSLAGLGTLAGLGFNLDFASGPLFAGVGFAAVGWRTRRAAPLLVYALTTLPWVAAGLGLNMAIGGSWAPPNMNPAYFRYPGSPFTEENMTGFLRHGPLNQALYAAGMMLGKHGFLNHNLPLLLAAAGAWTVFRRPFPGRAELVWLLAGCGAAWGLYAVLSNNMGGQCCSVRWFVPFLAPGFWLLGVLLKKRPDYRPDFYALAGWGAVLGGLMMQAGPWADRMVPLMWPVVGIALLTWAGVAARRWRQPAATIPFSVPASRRAA
ncbi:MAG TPA: hypothetical protein VH092_09975 [Urbifossiella sp.]|jgi:hypothetical protein|nr:hypothetical protein [Urbifossiella sp.]